MNTAFQIFNVAVTEIRCLLWAGVSYTGSEIINVHKTKEQREHNKTLFPNPNQNNNGSFVLRHLSPVHESLPLLWRHTFKKRQKYLYNDKNLKNIFL